MTQQIAPVTDEQEMLIIPDGFHGKVYVILRAGTKYLKVPARIDAWYEAINKDQLVIVVEGFQMACAEEWRP